LAEAQEGEQKTKKAAVGLLFLFLTCLGEKLVRLWRKPKSLPAAGSGEQASKKILWIFLAKERGGAFGLVAF
jgi:hypothetical protein